MMARQRFTNEQLKARLIVFIGVVLAVVFLGSVFGILWALIFVTQPLGEQAPPLQFVGSGCGNNVTAEGDDSDL
jgi:hypothetical protein